MWVRNGMSMRAQAVNYKEGILSHCYDNDLFLVQVCANLSTADCFMKHVVLRFGLLPAISKVDTSNSDAYLPGMENMVNLITITLSERLNICGVSVEDEIEREIIHYLACSRNGLAYSELTRQVSNRLIENAHLDDNSLLFDSVLKKVTNFKYPVGISDNGLYQLKPEYYDSVDPRFWHYSKNQREEVETILREISKKNGMKPSTEPYSKFDLDTEDTKFVRGPKIFGINERKYGLHRLNSLILSELFVDFIYTALEMAIACESDGLFSDVIYLIHLSIQIQKDGNLDASFTSLMTKSKSASVMSLLLHLLKREDERFVLFQPQIKVVVRSIYELNCELYVYELFRDNLITLLKSKNESTFGSQDEALAKKAASKARKETLIAQISKDQQSFMLNSEYVEIEDVLMEEIDASSRVWDFPKGACIVCQDELGVDGVENLYGMVSFCQTLHVKDIDFQRPDSVLGVLNCPYSLNEESCRDTPIFDIKNTLTSQSVSGNATINNPSENESFKDKPPHQVATTCGNFKIFTN